MNIALSALIISILLLPGAVVLTAYYTSIREKSSSYLNLSFSDLLFKGLIISFIIHCSSVCTIRSFGYQVNFQLLYDIIIANNKMSLSSAEFTRYVLEFCFYIIALILVFFVLTKLVKRFVLSKNLDMKYNFLRASNYWFLVFSARYLDKRIKGKKADTDLIYVDILATKDIIYSGFLFDFHYDPEKGELQYLVLKTAAKRTYIKTEGEEHKLKLGEESFINGDAFLIPAKEVININVYYIQLQDQRSTPTPPATV